MSWKVQLPLTLLLSVLAGYWLFAYAPVELPTPTDTNLFKAICAGVGVAVFIGLNIAIYVLQLLATLSVWTRVQLAVTLLLSVAAGFWLFLTSDVQFSSPQAATIFAFTCAGAAVATFIGLNVALLVLFFLLVMIGAIIEAFSGSITLPEAQHLRGRQITAYENVAHKANEELADDDFGLFWAGLRLPSHYATQHFLVAGVPGSGKTLTIHMLMASALPFVGKGVGHRALIYDVKRDSLSVLAGMGLYDANDPQTPTVILNPFDARSAAWHMAADITNETQAHAVGNILFPEEPNSNNKFFSKAAAALAGGVMTAFIHHAPGAWTFRDVLLALQSRETMRRLFLSCHETTSLLDSHLENRDVQGSVINEVVLFKPIAAAWACASRRFSLTDWEAGEGVLLLGTDPTAAPQLEAINRVLFSRTAQLLMSRDDYSARGRRTWLFLDECQTAKLEAKSLARLLEGGRSKGVAVVLGFQDIQGLRSAYGELEADSLITQCSNKALLRMDGDKSAEWATALVGQYDQEEYQKSYSSGNSRGQGGSGSSSNSTSYTLNRVQRDAIMPSEFMNFRTPDFDSGRPFDGVYLTRIGGVHRLALSPDYMLRYALPRPDRTVRDFIPRPAADLQLKPWTEEDLRRLNLDGEVLGPQSTPAPTPAARSKSNFSQVRRVSGE